MKALGLDEYIDATINSAETGFEKPNVRAFEVALRAAGDPAVAWMIGDRLDADVRGAEGVGLPAVLLTRGGTTAEARWHAASIREAVMIVTSTTSSLE